MKKIIISAFILSAIFISCKKEKAEIPAIAYEKHINFYNVSKDQSILKDWVDQDDTVTFDIFVTDYLTSDVQVSISIIDDLTTMSADMYTLSGTSFTIANGQLKTSGNVIFHYDAITDEPDLLYLKLEETTSIKNGFNDTLILTSLKMPNPTLTVFNDATLLGVYDGWDSPIAMAPVNAADPANSTMTMNNLWWGGEDIIVDFDLDNNTIHIDADQILDAAWAQGGYVLPWLIGEVNGTYDPIAKTITFDYEILDANHLLYGTEPCVIQDDV